MSIFLDSAFKAGGSTRMLKTIVIGSCVSVQGTFVRKLADGMISVRVGDKVFSGYPISDQAA